MTQMVDCWLELDKIRSKSFPCASLVISTITEQAILADMGVMNFSIELAAASRWLVSSQLSLYYFSHFTVLGLHVIELDITCPAGSNPFIKGRCTNSASVQCPKQLFSSKRLLHRR